MLNEHVFAGDYKLCRQKLLHWDKLILMIKGGFCCDIVLFYGNALKFITALIFKNRD